MKRKHAEARLLAGWKKNPLDINPYRLDYEWWRQPKLYKLWADRTADARNRMNEANSALDLMEAELTLKVGRYPSKFGFDKIPTVPAAKAAVTASPRYQKAVKVLNDAKHVLDKHQAMVTALDHKKKALEKGVDLSLSSYFAEPRNNREAGREFSKRRAMRSTRVSLE